MMSDQNSIANCTQQATTECHRLVQLEEWQSLVQRLKTEEGIAEAKTRDSHQRLIYHLENVYQAPLYVIKAMYEANGEGWIAPLHLPSGDGDHQGVTTYPIFLCITKSTQQNLALLLQKIPEVAKQKKGANLPLHEACRLGDDAMVRLLLAAYPDAASKESDRGHLPFSEGLDAQLKPESLLILLSSYPPAAIHRAPGWSLSLHIALEKRLDDAVITQIFHSYPEACRIKDDKGRLPIHYACARCDGPAALTSLATFEMILNEYPAGATEKDRDGYLPLHLLCWHFEDHENTLFLDELLRAHPDGALEKRNGLYPIDCLPGRCTRGLEYAWSKMLEFAPHTLAYREEVENPFIATARTGNPSEKIWRAVVRHCPSAVIEVDTCEGSALEVILNREGIDWQSAPTTEAAIALNTTFQVLQVTFGIRSGDPIIPQLIPQLHKLIYCGHLFLHPCNLPLPSANDMDREFFSRLVMQPEPIQGHTPLHVACCAPCPPAKHKEVGHCISLIATIVEKIPPEEQERCLSAMNHRGEIPLQLLLKNENPCSEWFLSDIHTLIGTNMQRGMAWDPSMRLYPFMIIASMNQHDRNPDTETFQLNCLSATYRLLQPMIACRNLSRIAAPKDDNDDTTMHRTA